MSSLGAKVSGLMPSTTPLLVGPEDGGVVPLTLGHVGEVQIALDLWLALQVVEDLGQLGPGQGGVRLHGGGAGALQEALLHGVVHVLVVPLVLSQVGKVLAGAVARPVAAEHRGDGHARPWAC